MTNKIEHLDWKLQTAFRLIKEYNNDWHKGPRSVNTRICVEIDNVGFHLFHAEENSFYCLDLIESIRASLSLHTFAKVYNYKGTDKVAVRVFK